MTTLQLIAIFHYLFQYLSFFLIILNILSHFLWYQVMVEAENGLDWISGGLKMIPCVRILESGPFICFVWNLQDFWNNIWHILYSQHILFTKVFKCCAVYVDFKKNVKWFFCGNDAQWAYSSLLNSISKHPNMNCQEYKLYKIQI